MLRIVNRRLLRAAVIIVFLVTVFVGFIPAAPPIRQAVRSGITISLKQEFIEKYKNRITIDADGYVVDKAHKQPNPGAKDGDLHVAGRAPEIGLATVAEIMNARLVPEFVDRIHQVEGKGQKIKVSGAWRLWCEHGGTKPQIQGAPLGPFTTTNPDHVFEIHPITKIDGESLVAKTFLPIMGFKTKDAHDAFVHYENIHCQITKNANKVTLVTPMAGFNYVEFILELNGQPENLEDGCAAFCKVLDLEGEILVRNRRMMFVEGSEAFNKVKDLGAGNRLHVLGIPRIDLALVSWRVANDDDEKFKDDKPTGWNLPYEMIIVALYP